MIKFNLFFFFYVTHTVHILQSIYQPTHALNKIQLTTSIKLPRVLALGCSPQGVIEVRDRSWSRVSVGNRRV